MPYASFWAELESCTLLCYPVPMQQLNMANATKVVSVQLLQMPMQSRLSSAMIGLQQLTWH